VRLNGRDRVLAIPLPWLARWVGPKSDKSHHRDYANHGYQGGDHEPHRPGSPGYQMALPISAADQFDRCFINPGVSLDSRRSLVFTSRVLAADVAIELPADGFDFVPDAVFGPSFSGALANGVAGALRSAVVMFCRRVRRLGGRHHSPGSFSSRLCHLNFGYSSAGGDALACCQALAPRRSVR
jgi:hypothetical protein